MQIILPLNLNHFCRGSIAAYCAFAQYVWLRAAMFSTPSGVSEHTRRAFGYVLRVSRVRAYAKRLSPFLKCLCRSLEFGVWSLEFGVWSLK